MFSSFLSLSFIPSFMRNPLMGLATVAAFGLSGCMKCHVDEMQEALSSCDNAEEFSREHCLDMDPKNERLIKDCKVVSNYLFRQCLYPDHYEECAGKPYGSGLICDCMNYGRNMFGECPKRLP